MEYRDDDGNKSIYRAGGELASSKEVKEFSIGNRVHKDDALRPICPTEPQEVPDLRYWGSSAGAVLASLRWASGTWETRSTLPETQTASGGQR